MDAHKRKLWAPAGIINNEINIYIDLYIIFNKLILILIFNIFETKILFQLESDKPLIASGA